MASRGKVLTREPRGIGKPGPSSGRPVVLTGADAPSAGEWCADFDAAVRSAGEVRPSAADRKL